jgi:hypothetical protein
VVKVFAEKLTRAKKLTASLEVRFPFDEFALPELSDWQPGTPCFGEQKMREGRYL